jgi:hypothetical protein
MRRVGTGLKPEDGISVFICVHPHSPSPHRLCRCRHQQASRKGTQDHNCSVTRRRGSSEYAARMLTWRHAMGYTSQWEKWKEGLTIQHDHIQDINVPWSRQLCMVRCVPTFKADIEAKCLSQKTGQNKCHYVNVWHLIKSHVLVPELYSRISLQTSEKRHIQI